MSALTPHPFLLFFTQPSNLILVTSSSLLVSSLLPFRRSQRQGEVWYQVLALAVSCKRRKPGEKCHSILRFQEVVLPWWVVGAPTSDRLQFLVVAMRLPEP